MSARTALTVLWAGSPSAILVSSSRANGAKRAMRLMAHQPRTMRGPAYLRRLRLSQLQGFGLFVLIAPTAGSPRGTGTTMHHRTFSWNRAWPQVLAQMML